MTGGVSMKKYAVMVLAVMLVGVLCGASFAATTKCTTCFGTGSVTCGVCHGTGICQQCYGNTWIRGVKCTACFGTGACRTCQGNREVRCSRCLGTGYVETIDDDPVPKPEPDPEPTPNPVSSSGGGCNSIAGLTAILLAAIILRKSHS